MGSVIVPMSAHVLQCGARRRVVAVLDRAVAAVDDHARRAERACREGGLERVVALRALGRVAERAERVGLLVVLREAERADHERAADGGDREHGAAGDRAAEPRPARVALLGRLVRRVARVVDGALARPEPAPADDGQERRQQRDAGQHHDQDADRVDRADRPGRGELGEDQHDHGEDHGAGAGDDRRRGARDRPLQRLVAVLVRVQLLGVAGHEQQAVVRARAEHQHRQQRGRDARDLHSGVGEELDHAAGDRVGDADDHQRDERQQRRAVDDQQQDQHQQAGHEQQREVGGLERVPEVGLERARAGDLGGQPAAGAGDLAHLLGDVADVLQRRGADRDHGEGRRAVRGHEALGGVGAERHRRRQHVLDLGHALRLGGDRLLVGAGQAAIAVIDGDRGRRLAAGEALRDHLVGDGRGGVVGQPARDPVLGDVGHRPRQRGQHRQHQPEADDHPLRPLPAREPPDRAQHSVAHSRSTRFRSASLNASYPR